MSLETTFLFSKNSLPEIAKAIGVEVEDGMIIKDYGGGLRAIIAEDSYTEQTLLRFSRKTDEGVEVIKEMSLNYLGVNISPSGVIFARPAAKSELINFSQLTTDKMPIIDGFQRYKGGARKAARIALKRQEEMFVSIS